MMTTMTSPGALTSEVYDLAFSRFVDSRCLEQRTCQNICQEASLATCNLPNIYGPDRQAARVRSHATVLFASVKV